MRKALPLISLAGFEHGPEWTIHGGSDLTTWFNSCLQQVSPAREHGKPFVSFFVVTWGTLSDRVIKTGIGRGRYHQPSGSIGIDVVLGKEIVLANREVMRTLFIDQILAASEKLVPFVESKGFNDLALRITPIVSDATAVLRRIELSDELSRNSQIIADFIAEWKRRDR